jgi:hypothetical protein
MKVLVKKLTAIMITIIQILPKLSEIVREQVHTSAGAESDFLSP